jgi:hypothetical protein
MTTSSLLQPARVWLRRGSLDRSLAAGADPGTSPELACRARQLTSPRFRAGLAASIRNLIDAAEEPRRGLSSAVPIQRREILDESGLLLELAADLESPDRLQPRGIALIERLLTNGDSPAYMFSPETSLREALGQARAALYLA